MSRISAYAEVPVSIEGHNSAAGVTIESLYEPSQNVIWDAIFPSAAKLQISSSSTLDAAGQSGAQMLEIVGLGADYAPLKELIAPNGQNYVETVNSFLRVFAVGVHAAGSGRTNAGDLYIIKTGTGGALTSGVPAAVTSCAVKLPAGYSESHSGMFVVPAGKNMRALSLSVGAGTQGVVIMIFTRKLSVANAPLERVFSQVVGVNTGLDIDLKNSGLVFREKTQIELKALGLASSANVWAKLTLGN